MRLLDTPERAARALREELRRLIALQLKDRMKYLRRNPPDLPVISLDFIKVGSQGYPP